MPRSEDVSVLDHVIPPEHKSTTLNLIFCLAWFMYLFIVAEVAIVSTYMQLCHQNYRWWWRAYFIGASPAFYLYVLAFIFKICYMIFDPVSSSLPQFSAYMIVISLFCFSLALMGGSIAVMASLTFNKMIYKQVRLID